MSAFELQSCNDEAAWNDFLQHSPQASVYCEPGLIDALGCKADLWFVMRNGYPAAAVPVITDNSICDGLPIHSYYTGLMLHRESWNCKANRRTENLLDISAAMMEQLSTCYEHLQFSLHPDITDIRGFDWFNYHSPEHGRASVLPRYTAMIELDADIIRHSARSSRRREERYASERESMQFSTDGSPDDLILLWQYSLQRQGNEIEHNMLQQTRAFAQKAIDDKRAVIGIVRDNNGTAHAAGMLLYDYNGKAHLPVVGTSESRYAGTLLYFKLMDTAAEQGCRVLDFNGANSPARAYFKHSIGGDSTLFFHIDWKKP